MEKKFNAKFINSLSKNKLDEFIDKLFSDIKSEIKLNKEKNFDHIYYQLYFPTDFVKARSGHIKNTLIKRLKKEKYTVIGHKNDILYIKWHETINDQYVKELVNEIREKILKSVDKNYCEYFMNVFVSKKPLFDIEYVMDNAIEILEKKHFKVFTVDDSRLIIRWDDSIPFSEKLKEPTFKKINYHHKKIRKKLPTFNIVTSIDTTK